MQSNLFDNFKKNNEIFIDPGLIFDQNVKVNIKGHNHKITIEKNVILRNLNINITGSGNTLYISKNCIIRGTINIRQSNSCLIIGEGTTTAGVHFFAMEGKKIQIGSDCMFSSSIFIRTSDEHPIFDLETGQRINHAKDVFVEDHVWIGEGTTVNKGAFIPKGCIIGTKSLVAKTLTRPSASYAGCPAKLIREQINWERNL